MATDTEKKNARAAQGDAHFDYKNTAFLSEYVNPHARIVSRKRTNLSARRQRLLARAIKRARFMALMPYTAE